MIGSEPFDESYRRTSEDKREDTVTNVTRDAAGMVISEVLFSFPVCSATTRLSVTRVGVFSTSGSSIVVDRYWGIKLTALRSNNSSE